MLVGFPVRQFQLCKEGVSNTNVKKQKIEIVMTKVMKTVTENVVTQRQVMNASGQLETRNVTIPKTFEKEIEVPIETMVEQVLDNDEGDCLWIDEQAVQEYIKRGYSFTGEKRMTYCPPEWITGIDKPSLLILDDYSRADARFIQACMTLN